MSSGKRRDGRTSRGELGDEEVTLRRARIPSAQSIQGGEGEVLRTWGASVEYKQKTRQGRTK